MIPFSPPHIDDEIINEVVSALRSGWITTGPKTKQLEKNLTAYIGNQTTVCLSSATAGLELVLRWFGVKEGDEVIIPAYTYAATANVVIHTGATPVMVDSNEDFNISLESIRKAVSSKTKVIIPVDIAGFPCDYDALHDLIAENEILELFTPTSAPQKQLGKMLVLVDAAHSFGATYKGKRSGLLAPVSVFSFHAVKNLTTAEGGAIAFNFTPPFDNQALYQEFCTKILHGQNKDALAKTQKGNWEYDIVEAGYKANMTDIHAAIGLVELKRYQETLQKRKEIFEFYTSFFNSFTWAKTPVYITTNKQSSFHIYLLRINGIDEQTRNKIIQKIFDFDVSVNVHFKPLPLFSFYKNLGYQINDYPQAFKNYEQVITLPVYFDLTTEQLQQITLAVKNAVEQTLNA